VGQDTIFDKIIRKEIPASIVYEDGVALAFRDINPQAPTHVLVVPKHKIDRFANLGKQSSEIAGQFFQTVAKIASELGLDKNGYRIVINNGHDGQQTVEYLHAHIIGGRPMTWPPG
jgi:histidine triad (HIT) family protein